MDGLENPTITVHTDSHTNPHSDIVKRKHRTGLRRVQIACERCRSRKNKCDRKLPECSTCKAAGVPCVVLDRVTNRQYQRGHLQDLEAQVQSLAAQVQQLELEKKSLEKQLASPPDYETTRNNTRAAFTPSTTEQPSASGDDEHEIADHLNTVADEITSGPRSRYVGDSSGLFFSNIVRGVLLNSDYKGGHGPSPGSLQLRVGQRYEDSSPVPKTPVAGLQALSIETVLPSMELADKLQSAYFTYRWPALPFLHRSTFLEKHFTQTMTLKNGADQISIFLTLMVFALGAIDLKRQDSQYPTDQHLDFFTFATTHHLDALLRVDNLETVQGLLLVAQFAVNEHRSANAWHVAGQAVRTAVDLGIHRNNIPSSHGLSGNMLLVEMQKRVFWSAYCLDRNISIALGRPCALQDSDIDVQLPQNLKDDDLEGECLQASASREAQFSHLDMSTFIHIIKLRQIQSRIQRLFYSAHTSELLSPQGPEHHRNLLRGELTEWIAMAPRYRHPTVVTFQSTEWFQIAYSHALLLLYRPSPASPTIDIDSLQICGDAAISLISSYSSLYAKNKITYTWIALHSLFMASVTMLYTLWVCPKIRASTTKAVVNSNVMSCLALFEIMSEHWPLAIRCHSIIENLGNASVALFDTSSAMGGNRYVGAQGPDALDSSASSLAGTHFSRVHSEFMDWFGTREATVSSREEGVAPEAMYTNVEAPTTTNAPLLGTAETPLQFMSNAQLAPSWEGFLGQDFDMTLPMLMNAFECDPQGS